MPLSTSHAAGQLSSGSALRQYEPTVVASGRKSPDPFRRFRRNSSSTVLSSQSRLPTSQSSPSPSTSTPTRITSPGGIAPAGVAPTAAAASAAAAAGTPRLPTRPTPPPKPSAATKPPFARIRKAKPASLSLLGGGSASGSVDRPSTNLDPFAAVDASQEPGPSKLPSPASGRRFVLHRRPSRSTSVLDITEPSSPRKHTQAWYQSQQRTVDLPQPGRPVPTSASQPDSFSPGSIGSPSRYPHRLPQSASAVVSANDEEMLAAGVHVIRRRHDTHDLQSPPSRVPLPGRTYKASENDPVETITPFITAGDGSSSFEGSINEYLSANSSTISLVAPPVPAGRRSLDQSPRSQLHSKGSASSGFSPSPSHESMRPATSMSFRHDDHSPSNTSLPRLYGTDTASLREVSGRKGYLSPAPGTSAHPFLNRHAATVGKSSGSFATGNTARNGLANYFRAPSPSATSLSSYPQRETEILDKRSPALPPRSARAKPSSLSPLPPGRETLSPSRAPHSAVPVLTTSLDAVQARAGGGIPRTDHLSLDDLVRSRTPGPDAARAGASTPLPRAPPALPPRRTDSLIAVRGRQIGSNDVGLAGNGLPPARSPAPQGGMATALGQVGQMGAAVGRKGWEFMRTLNGGGSSGVTSGVTASRSAIPVRIDTSSRSAAIRPTAEGVNHATQQWLAALEGGFSRPAQYGGTAATRGRGRLFGVPLRDAVLRSRLLEQGEGQHGPAGSDARLSVPDLGQDFSVNMSFLDEPRTASSRRASRNRQSVPGKVPASRHEARELYLPGIVVRCIESLERWGPQEEGIYRLSGRTSHTSKLRSVFDEQGADLCLEQISPADLDINSVCSLLKSYLRELPDGLVPASSTVSLDQAATRMLGATGATVSEGAVSRYLLPVITAMPCVNWYLLREMCEHLGWLSRPEVVAQTKMPLSNLCLVLAPTLSLSVVMLKLLVEHRGDVFTAPGPAPDAELDAAFGKKPLTLQGGLAPNIVAPPSLGPSPAGPSSAQTSDMSSTGPKPSTPSRLPQHVRKRSSTASVAALLTGNSSISNVLRSERRNLDGSALPQKPAWMSGHRSRPSISSNSSSSSTQGRTPQLGPYETMQSSFSPSEANKSPRAGLYDRPSTSLGHFAELDSQRERVGLGIEAASPTRFGRSRDAATRFGALGLDSPLSPRRQQSGPIGLLPTSATRSRFGDSVAAGNSGPVPRELDAKDNEAEDDQGPPIARYYAKLRQDAAATPAPAQRYRFGATSLDRSPLDRALTPSTGSSIPVLSAKTSSPVHQLWSQKKAADLPPSAASSLYGDGAGLGDAVTLASRQGATSGALDRPRPPTRTEGPFFAGRDRRKNSIAGLDGFVVPARHTRGLFKGPSSVTVDRSREASNEGGETSLHDGHRPYGVSGGTRSSPPTSSIAASHSTSSLASEPGETTRPLNIIKKSTSSIIDEAARSAVTKKASTASLSYSTNTLSTTASSSVGTQDTPMTRSLEQVKPPRGAVGTDDEADATKGAGLERMDAASLSRSVEYVTTDVRSDIERYLEHGMGRVGHTRGLFERTG